MWVPREKEVSVLLLSDTVFEMLLFILIKKLSDIVLFGYWLGLVANVYYKL